VRSSPDGVSARSSRVPLPAETRVLDEVRAGGTRGKGENSRQTVGLGVCQLCSVRAFSSCGVLTLGRRDFGLGCDGRGTERDERDGCSSGGGGGGEGRGQHSCSCATVSLGQGTSRSEARRGEARRGGRGVCLSSCKKSGRVEAQKLGERQGGMRRCSPLAGRAKNRVE
jgi:hypothetical protein